jgi:hypothetical protein
MGVGWVGATRRVEVDPLGTASTDDERVGPDRPIHFCTDERDYAILKQILVTLSILGAITMGQVNFPDGLEKVISIAGIAGKD